MVVKIFAQSPDNVQLLLDRQTSDRGFDDVSNRRRVHGNEAVVVHERKESHDKLAVHAVCDAAVSRDRLAKVLDFERALEAGRKEPAEGSNKGSKSSEDEDVELHWRNMNSANVGPGRKMVGLRRKDGVGRALQTRQDVRPEVIDRAGEVFVSHENVGHSKAKQDGTDPGANKTLYRLLW